MVRLEHGTGTWWCIDEGCMLAKFGAAMEEQGLWWAGPCA